MNRDLEPEDFARWPNFGRHEFACKGSGQCRMAPLFMDKVQLLRERYNKPMRISSGYRSPEHNAKVSSTGTEGPHTTGRAVDIMVSRGDAYLLLKLALEMNFTGIGISQKGENRFIHLDDLTEDETAPRPTVWSY